MIQYSYAENYQVIILHGTSDQSLGLKLYPEILPFGPDDTITWKNEDSTVHSMTSGIGAHPEYSGKFFRTGNISPGESSKVKFDVKNNFAFYYFCEIHPWLSGKLVVETAPESQPETTNPIVTDKSQQKYIDISVSGQVHQDFRKTAYDILVYHNQELVDVKHGLLDESGAYTNTIATDSMEPGKYTLKVVYGLPTQIGITSFEIRQKEASIPKWIRTEAGGWADGTISDSEFVKAIEYLAKEKIIKIQKSESSKQTKTIPAWLKSSAGWWSSGQISDVEFAKGLQYLSDAGIIQI